MKSEASHDRIGSECFCVRTGGAKMVMTTPNWSLVETVGTPDGPRQKTLCYLGELNSFPQARWSKTMEVFNEQGETQQRELFPLPAEVPLDDPQVAWVLLNKV